MGTLISNDLYVLTLNGESNCILPRVQEKRQLQSYYKKKEKTNIGKKGSLLSEREELKEPTGTITPKSIQQSTTPPVVNERP